MYRKMVVFLIGHILPANQIHSPGFWILSDFGYFDVVGVLGALQRAMRCDLNIKLFVNRNICVVRMLCKQKKLP